MLGLLINPYVPLDLLSIHCLRDVADCGDNSFMAYSDEIWRPSPAHPFFVPAV